MGILNNPISTFNVPGAYSNLYVDKGTPYLLWHFLSPDSFNGSNNFTTVIKRAGTEINNWVDFGKIETPTFNNYHLFVYDEIPYVVFTNLSDERITVIKFDGNNWVPVGKSGFFNRVVTGESLFVENGTVYVSFVDSDDMVVVMKFNGNEWEPIGKPFFPNVHSITSLYVSNGIPYVCIGNSLDPNKQLIKYTGKGESGWIDIGESKFNGIKYFSFCVDKGIPYVGFADPKKDNKLTIEKYE